MSDEQCAKYIDGIAVHWYLDFIVPVKVLNEVHKNFGDKIIMNTEASQGLLMLESKVFVVILLRKGNVYLHYKIINQVFGG